MKVFVLVVKDSKGNLLPIAGSKQEDKLYSYWYNFKEHVNSDDWDLNYWEIHKIEIF